MRARTVRVDRWEKTPTRTAQDKIKIKNPSKAAACRGSLFCTNLTQPTGNLDSKTTMEVLQLMQKIVREQNQTLVMVTHDNNLASYADRRIRIVDGKIVNIEVGQRRE